MGVTFRENPKGSGKYMVFVRHQNRRRSFAVPGGRVMAKQMVKDFEDVLRENPDSIFTKKKKEREVPTFRKLAEEWLASHRGKESTLQRYESLLKAYVYPTIGQLRVDHIRRADCKMVITKARKRGDSRSQQGLIRTTMVGVLEEALDHEFITANPARRILGKGNVRRPKRPTPFTEDERNLFMEATIKEDAREDNHRRTVRKWYPLFLFLFHSGCRLGEALAIEWKDVDLDAKTTHINKSYRRPPAPTSTKTGEERTLDLNDDLVACLRETKRERAERALRSGVEASPMVFANSQGRYTSQNTTRNAFKRIAASIGLEDKRIHDTRHTFASLMLSKGVAPTYTQKQLGHASLAMTLDVYSHWLPNNEEAPVNALNQANGEERKN